MKRLDGKGDVKIGWRSRLVGFRMVEESDDHIVIRMPWWVPKSVVPKVAKGMAEDSSLLDRGRDVTYRTAGHMMRVERSAGSTTEGP